MEVDIVEIAFQLTQILKKKFICGFVKDSVLQVYFDEMEVSSGYKGVSNSEKLKSGYGMEQRLLTTKETVVYLGLSIDNLYQKISRRQIPFLKIGKSLRFDKTALEEWIKKNSVGVIK